MPEPIACKRHPGTQTRLRCQTCEDPICPQCLVQTPVGQKCPTDAKQPKSALALGTPAQLVKGVGAGIAAAVVLAVAMWLVLGASFGFFSLLLSFGAGSGVGEAVRRGAEGNGSTRFRNVAMVLAGAMMLGVWLVGFGALVPRGLLALTYPAAIYGAGQRFPWA